jgi:hypothetical protein
LPQSVGDLARSDGIAGGVSLVGSEGVKRVVPSTELCSPSIFASAQQWMQSAPIYPEPPLAGCGSSPIHASVYQHRADSASNDFVCDASQKQSRGGASPVCFQCDQIVQALVSFR